MKFVVGENGRNPEKNLPIPRFVHHETHMETPRRELRTPAVRGERLTACATRPPSIQIYTLESPKIFDHPVACCEWQSTKSVNYISRTR